MNEPTLIASDLIRLAVLTPSRIDTPLRQALAAAARLGSIRLLDEGALREAASPIDLGGLIVCADISAIDAGPVGVTAVVIGGVGGPAGVGAAPRLEGLHYVSRCLAHAIDHARVAQAPVFPETAFLNEAEATLADLLGRLHLPLDPADEKRIGQMFGDAIRALRASTPASDPEDLSARALAMFGPDGPDGRPPSAWWDRVLFQYGDRPGETCPPVMDVTGARRSLVFGPYITLPPGTWRAEVAFDVCPDAARRSYRVDFGSNAAFSHRDVGPLRAGRNVVTVDHHFGTAEPAWVRLAVARAAFHGEMCFLGAKIIRIGDDDYPTRVHSR